MSSSIMISAQTTKSDWLRMPGYNFTEYAMYVMNLGCDAKHSKNPKPLLPPKMRDALQNYVDTKTLSEGYTFRHIVDYFATGVKSVRFRQACHDILLLPEEVMEYESAVDVASAVLA